MHFFQILKNIVTFLVLDWGMVFFLNLFLCLQSILKKAGLDTSKTTDNKPLKLEAHRPFSLFEKIKAEYTHVQGFFFPQDILPTGYASKNKYFKEFP